jgi:hypothetical protein
MLVQYKTFNSTRNFGVELEVGNEYPRGFISNIIKNTTNMKVNISNYTQSVNNAHWVVKTDASCGRRVKSNGINEGGYEIASFVASGIEDIEKISKVAHNLKRSGVRANNNCGYHIHINASDFNEEEMGQLISYWLLIEDVFFNMVPFRRTVNRYCKKVKIKNNNYKNAMSVIKNSMKIWEMYRPKTINIRNPTEKRYSLNLLNYFVASKTKFKRKTIEFRFPEGTLCQETIKNFIFILLSFVENMKSIKPPKSKNMNIEFFFNICGFGDGKSLCILDHDLIKTKIWVLKRLIRFSKVHEYKNQAKKLLTRIYRGYGNAKTF